VNSSIKKYMIIKDMKEYLMPPLCASSMPPLCAAGGCHTKAAGKRGGEQNTGWVREREGMSGWRERELGGELVREREKEQRREREEVVKIGR
jgi:hypothetical protein